MSSFTTTILNLLFADAKRKGKTRSFQMYIGPGSDGSSADKLSLDLKFCPWDTAITFRPEWPSMSKTVHAGFSFVPFEDDDMERLVEMCSLEMFLLRKVSLETVEFADVLGTIAEKCAQVCFTGTEEDQAERHDHGTTDEVLGDQDMEE